MWEWSWLFGENKIERWSFGWDCFFTLYFPIYTTIFLVSVLCDRIESFVILFQLKILMDFYYLDLDRWPKLSSIHLVSLPPMVWKGGHGFALKRKKVNSLKHDICSAMRTRDYDFYLLSTPVCRPTSFGERYQPFCLFFYFFFPSTVYNAREICVGDFN